MSSPMQALVTGATGFVGGHLARRLQRAGWGVQAMVRASSQAGPLREMLGPEHVHVHDGTTENLADVVRRTKPAIVFHLASLYLAQHQAADVSALIRSNVEFATQLAEAAAAQKVPHFVNTGTAWQHYRDEDFNPVNLYAATKQAFASILRYYAESGALRVVNLELFDTLGPGDTRPKLFSALRKAAQSGATLAMSGGEQEIDLVYIDDVIDAYMAAALRLRQGGGSAFETFAVCSGQPRRLRDVVALWQRITYQQVNISWGAKPYRPREPMTSWNRGVPVPGWRAGVGLEEGIRRMEGQIADANRPGSEGSVEGAGKSDDFGESRKGAAR